MTGPLQIRSDASGGTISGDLKLNKGRFQLGRASAAAAVPQLNVRELGLDPEDVIEAAAIHPWKLDLKLAGSDLQVTGLGINSRWTHEPPDRRLRRRAALHRPRRPRPRRL